MEVNKSQKIRPQIHDLSAFKQVMESRSHPLDMVREAISNMMAPEVGASRIFLQHYTHPEYNASFIFKDDGIGMTYSGDAKNPGRLDRFIGLAFSKSAGLGGNYWGWKGLGSKLMLNCTRLVIETWTGIETDDTFKVEIYDPRLCLLSDPPREPVYELIQRPANLSDHKGTTINIYGYDGGQRNYSFKELRNYLYLNTAVGLTSQIDGLPEVHLKVSTEDNILSIGFEYITNEDDSWRTVVIDTPIEKSENVQDENSLVNNVQVVLKGGFTLDTGQFGLSAHRYNTGLRLSVKGIPYFQLPLYAYKGNKFNQYKDLCSFIVECDALESKLNMDRSAISNQHGDDTIVKTFKRLTTKCFDEFAESQKYREFMQRHRKEDERSKANALIKRQEALSNSSQEYICYQNEADEPVVLHKAPSSEQDTLAVFWKLESQKLLPFEKFISLEHTAQKGIDVIATFQIDDESSINQFVSVEFEHVFSNFIKHGHNPKQTSLIVCWEVDKSKDLTKINQYQYRYDVGSQSIHVFEIKSFPGVIVKSFSEIDI